MSLVQLKARIQELLFSRTTRLVSGLAGGNFIAMVVSIAGSLVQAQFVSPADLGYFRSFAIATGYLFFLNMGSFNAIHRFYPFYIGKGQKDKALAIVEIGQAWNAAITVLVSLVFLVLALLALLQGDWQATLAWLVQVVTISTVIYGGYLGVTYRTGNDFLLVAKGSVISSVVNLFTLPLFLVWPYLALVLRSSLGSIVNLVYLHLNRTLRPKLRFNWPEWFGMVRQGVPIFTATYGYITFWAVVQSTLVFTYLGTHALGLWSMTVIFLEAMNKIPQALVAVYMPRVTEMYGRTENISECVALMRKPILAGFFGTLIIAIGGAVVMPLVLPLIIPKYIEAIPVMGIMLFALPLMVLELPNALLVAMNKILEFNIAVYVGLGGFVLLSLLAFWLGWGLNGLALASLVGIAIRTALIFWFIYAESVGIRLWKKAGV